MHSTQLASHGPDWQNRLSLLGLQSRATFEGQAQVMSANSLSEVVMAVAFTIEDPCGVEAIELARALIELGRAVPEERRKNVVALCRTWTRSFAPEAGG